MTESSPVNKPEDKAKSNTADSKTVPVEAIGDARAKTRAANERANSAEAELAKAKATELDPTDYQSIVEALTAEARKQVEAEIAPYKAKAAKAEMAMQFGLSNEQADKVMEVKSQNPNLSEAQALLLAKAEHADLFKPQNRGFDPRIHGGLPVGGFSESRTQPAPNDYMAKIEEARKAGNREGVRHYAEKEVLSRFRAQFEKSRALRSTQ
jgi:hypothetical protein